MAEAMKAVPREKYMAERHKKSAYRAYSAFPIPPFTGQHTISAPNTYPLFYEPLDIEKGDVCLEIGTGSGYGAALLKEMVGKTGTIVTVETNRQTYEFGKNNLQKTGYEEVIVVHRDGTKGYPPEAPYDKIVVTASFFKIPSPLKEQLKAPGKLIMPVGQKRVQNLTMLMKDQEGNTQEKVLDQVLYVPLRGKHGYQKPK